MATSSTYNVNIIISTKDKSTQATKRAVGSWTELKSALGLAKAAFNAVYQAADKAYKFVEAGAAIMQARDSLNYLAQAAGSSGDAIVKSIQEASDYTIDRMTAMQVANKALLMGVAKDPEQFRELAHTATILGRAMGLDAVQAIDRFTVAAGRKSVKVADDLGLLIDASLANEKYARTLGKTVEELTAAEQSQAFLNAMNEAAAPKVAALEGANAGLSVGLAEVKAAIKDTVGDLQVMAAETAENTVNTHALAVAIREIPDALREAQQRQVEYSNSLGEAEAYLSGDVLAIDRYTTALKKSSTVISGYNGYVSDGVSTLSAYHHEITQSLPQYDGMISRTLNAEAALVTLNEQEQAFQALLTKKRTALEENRKALQAQALASQQFALQAGMQWKSYFDGVDQQAEDFETRREQLDAEHQEKIAELLKRGQGKAISIDEEAEQAKLALLQERLTIALQQQAEFTDKTHESTKMAKDLAIRQLQGQVSAQQKLLDDYYAGRLKTTGENVNALIGEENRRHQEAITGLQEEIATTKELQKQQLGTLMLQTFETWAELEDVPAEAMLNMRTGIAKEYGLISEEEATLIGLSIQSWTNWKNSAYENTELVISQLNKTITSVHLLQQALAGLPGGGMGEMVPTMPGAGFYAGVPTAAASSPTYNFNQTVNTRATTANVMRDFSTARALYE